MVQVHSCNVIYAIVNTFYTGPQGLYEEYLLNFVDLWIILVYTWCFSVMYLTIFDRLGIHLYPILSPRLKSVYVVLIWISAYSLLGISYYVCNQFLEETYRLESIHKEEFFVRLSFIYIFMITTSFWLFPLFY